MKQQAAPPNLQELVAHFGRYDMITAEAWAEFDQAMADYQSARREALVSWFSRVT
jgi:hypothetical protein